MDKFRYFITGMIVLAVALVYVFFVKVQKPGLDMRISIEKDTYLYGEDFDVKYTLENLSDKVDSVLHFGEGFLSCESLMIDNVQEVSHGGISPIIGNLPFYKYKYIKPGEKLTQLENLNFWRSNGKLAYGEYILRGICEADTGKYLFSNTVVFHVVYPKGDDLEAYKVYNYVENYQEQFNNRVRTKDDDIILTDKIIEVLYKYPKSVYSGKLLCRSNTYREAAKYKYDESYLKDIEFFIENNPNSHYLNELLYNVSSLNRNKLGGNKKAVEYLNSLKIKFNNNKLNKLIGEHLVRDDDLK